MILYTDIDPKVCAWTEELIANGSIPPGDVLCKSIIDIKPQDLHAYTQVHFFNGISGWSAALKLAGWPTNRRVWCASLPCQPFSAAGKQEGVNDERHLWPVFFGLVKAGRPDVIFGEQVSSPLALGWLDGVFTDLENEGYTCEAVDLCAASAGAPHIRQRIYWVAHAKGLRLYGGTRVQGENGRRELKAVGTDSWLANADGREPGDGRVQPGGEHRQQPEDCGIGGLGDSQSSAGGLPIQPRGQVEEAAQFIGAGEARGLEHAESNGRIERRSEPSRRGTECGCGSRFWDDYSVILCTDGKYRRIPPVLESGLQPVVDGLPVDVDAGWRQSNGQVWPLAQGVKGRVGLLFGAGNAIVPELAAQFISAFMETHEHPSPRE